MREFFMLVAAGCIALLAESLCLRFMSWFLKPKASARRLTLIPMAGDCPELEASLRWQFFRREADPAGGDNVILVVDCGASVESREQAERLCRGRRNCAVCTLSELDGIVGAHSVCKGVELVLY